MCKCKTEAIQTDLGTFRHNQAHPGIIQAYSGIFKTMCNPGILRNVALSEPWYIQNPPPHIHNPRIFRTLAYSKSEAYSESWQTSGVTSTLG